MKRHNDQSRVASNSRRRFLQQSGGLVASAAIAGSLTPRVHAAESNTIKIALVGCGGRGTGAALNALSTKGPTKLYAVADVFDDRQKRSLQNLQKSNAEQIDVPAERRFIGMDAYKQAIDALDPGDLVILATPPAFRPIHLEYAVAKGRHVFMEKSFAVDAPGIRRVLQAGDEAKKKNLKIAGGLMSRHYRPLEEAVQKVREGLIGDVITCWAYRMHGPVGYRKPIAGESELQHQIRNYSCFTWLNGSFLLDWLIHNLDVCCWVKDAWPVSCQGQGGRELRIQPDQLFDHYAAEYRFPDGTRLMAQGRHMDGCWGFFGDVILGTKGSAVLGEGIAEPKLYKGHQPVSANEVWRYEGPTWNAYQTEHDELFDAIRNDKPYNEAERCAKSAMVGILGRMACESGKEVTWDEAMQSELALAPGLENFTLESPAPVTPDAEGKYPVAMPGLTKAF
ncbi:MAG: Gfo/Idh/MocA family protein [Planctomycetota bacterium]